MRAQLHDLLRNQAICLVLIASLDSIYFEMAEEDGGFKNKTSAVSEMEKSERVKVICLGDSAVGKSK